MKGYIRAISLEIRKRMIYLRGVVHLGPTAASHGVEAIRMALDEFEGYYARLPREDEQKRLVTKLAWLEQQYKRLPTHEEMERIIQQLEIHS